MHHERSYRHGRPADGTMADGVRRLVAERGETAAAAALGVGRPAIARVLGGLGLRRATLTAIESRLRELATGPEMQP